MTYRRPNLLIVEADEILADVTAFRLELLGYEVRTLPDATNVLGAIQEKRPDMLICDVVLPGLSGTALIEKLAADPETAKLPVLALSVEADMETVQRAISAGAADFLVVPFDPLVLEAKVEQLISIAKRSEKTASTVSNKG